MLTHVLGWLVVAAQVGGSVFLARWLWGAFRRPWSWTHAPRVPKVEGVSELGSGSDYVGFV